MAIEWYDNLETGVQVIDDQHKKIVALINSLQNSLVEGSSSGRVDEILNDLMLYTKEHFSFEEKLFMEHNFPYQAEHRKEHEELISQVNEFSDKLQLSKKNGSTDSPLLAINLAQFLKQWLVEHIEKEDKLYAPYILEGRSR